MISTELKQLKNKEDDDPDDDKRKSLRRKTWQKHQPCGKHITSSHGFCSGYFQAQEEGWEVALDAGTAGRGGTLISPSGCCLLCQARAHWEPPCWNPCVHPDLQHISKHLWQGDFTSHCLCTTGVCSSCGHSEIRGGDTFMEASVWKQCRAGITACFHKTLQPRQWSPWGEEEDILYKEQSWQSRVTRGVKSLIRKNKVAGQNLRTVGTRKGGWIMLTWKKLRKRYGTVF